MKGVGGRSSLSLRLRRLHEFAFENRFLVALGIIFVRRLQE